MQLLGFLTVVLLTSPVWATIAATKNAKLAPSPSPSATPSEPSLDDREAELQSTDDCIKAAVSKADVETCQKKMANDPNRKLEAHGY